MGWFSRACSFVGSVASSAGRAISSGVRSLVGAASSVGSAIFSATRSTVSFLAEKAKSWGSILKETAVGAVKGGAKGFLSGGLGGALMGAMKGGFAAGVREYGRQFLSDEEEEEEKEDYREQNSVEVESDPEVERLAGVIQEFIPALQRKFASNAPVESFEEYLRIDISMLFIRDLIKKFSKLKSPSDLTQSDRRFIVLIDQLVMDKPMTEADLQEFDVLVKQRYKKGLLLMGSERLFALWTNEEEICKKKVKEQRNEMAWAELRLKELQNRSRYNIELTEAERLEWAELKVTLGEVNTSFTQDKKYLDNIRIVTGVSEGLLQQAEADNAGTKIRERDRLRNDRAGAILVNMERNLDKIQASGDLLLEEHDEAFLMQYVDLYVPDAVERKDKLSKEYVVEITV